MRARSGDVMEQSRIDFRFTIAALTGTLCVIIATSAAAGQRRGLAPSTLPSSLSASDLERPDDFSPYTANMVLPDSDAKISFAASPAADDPRVVRVLVFSQYYMEWIIYPGADGKLGRYFI